MATVKPIGDMESKACLWPPLTGGQSGNCGIYLIEIYRPGKENVFYIGQSIDIRERIKQHIRALRANRHDNRRIANLVRKYGENCLHFSIILICEPKVDLLCLYEQSILNFYVSTYGRNRVVNILQNCINTHLGVKRRPESIAKLAAANRGKKRTQEQIERNRIARTGFKHSEKTKKLISQIVRKRGPHPNALAAIARVRDTTRIDALRKALAGKPKIHSEETKKKISLSLLGRVQDRELVERRISKIRGRKQSAEHVAKRVASRLANKIAENCNGNY